MNVPRTGAKAVVVGHHVYVIGGGQGVPGPDTIHQTVEYSEIQPDGSLGPWQMTAELNTPRMFLAVTQSKDTIYAMGGEYFPQGQMKLLNSVEWARVRKDGQLAPWIESSPMNTPRRSPTDTIAANYLYAIGGYNGTFLRTVERSSISKDGSLGPWEFVPQLLTTPRYIHGGGTAHGRIYVVGGHLETKGGGSTAAEWTVVDEKGQLQPWKSTSSLSQPRFLAGSAASEDHFYIVGGYDGKYLDSVERSGFQPDGNLEDWVQVTPLSTPREGAAVAIYQDNIYVMGGSSKAGYLTRVEHAKIANDGSLGHWKKQSAD